MVNQTQQIFCCLFQNLVSGRSAACVEGEEGGTGWSGAFSSILMKQNKPEQIRLHSVLNNLNICTYTHRPLTRVVTYFA